MPPGFKSLFLIDGQDESALSWPVRGFNLALACLLLSALFYFAFSRIAYNWGWQPISEYRGKNFLWRRSMTRAKRVSSPVRELTSSSSFGSRSTGRLSTQKKPASSSVFATVDLPDPDIPVTTTTFFCIKVSPFHFA